jgi:hypothetical protein
MSPKARRIRTPVRREKAEIYILISLLSFGFSVGVTRLFLSLTGFPQIGNSQFHISHVLWGGLALFIAALLPLIFANRWVYLWGAVLAGVGVGLFIDEVGKFITQTNDYFYPPAAPIIYAFFLATVLLYFQIRSPHPRDDRTELYHALDALEEILDHDLEPSERSDLIRRLNQVVEDSDHPDLSTLAAHLLQFVQSEPIWITESPPTFPEKLAFQWKRWNARWLTERRLRAILIGLLGALGASANLRSARLLILSIDPAAMDQMIRQMVQSGLIASPAGASWYVVRLALESIVGGLLIISAGLLLFNRKVAAFRIGLLGLVLSLTAVNLLVFYFDQFSTILAASIQFVTLILLLFYRNRLSRGGAFDGER